MCMDFSERIRRAVLGSGMKQNELAGRIWLRALNPAYPPITDTFTVLGTVIGKWEDA